MMKKIIILLALTLMLAGCQAYQPQAKAVDVGASSEQSSAAAGPQSSQNMNADIEGFEFKPATIRIKTGDTVVWANKDDAPHTVTSVSGPARFGSGNLNNGQTFSQTFTTPGTYEYECSIHPNMQGTVIVE